MPNRRRDRDRATPPGPAADVQPWRNLLDHASELCRRRLSEVRTDGHWYAVVLPDLRPAPFFVSLLGNAGLEYGIALFCDEGDDAAQKVANAIASGTSEAVSDLYMIGCTLTRFRGIPDPLRDMFRRAGRFPPPHELVPLPCATDGDRSARDLREVEARWLLGAIDASLAAEGVLRQMVDPHETTTLRRPVLTLVGRYDSQGAMQVEIEHRMFRCTGVTRPRAAPLLELPAALRRHRCDDELVVGSVPLQVDAGTRLAECAGIVVVDRDRELVIGAKVVVDADSSEASAAVLEVLASDLYREPGLPRALRFTTPELFRRLEPTLAAAGVDCRMEVADEYFVAIAEDMRAHLGAAADLGSAGQETDADMATRLPHDAVPADDDLVAWKAADLALVERIVAMAKDEDLFGPLILARYYGGPVSGDRGVPVDWIAMCFRGDDGTTLAERLLDGDLPAAQRQLLAARCAATPSIYRIAATDPHGTVTLVDVFDGREVAVHDLAMSRSATPQWLVPFLVFPAGRFHLGASLGPGLPPLATNWLLELIPNRAALANQPELAGHLWSYAAPGPPQAITPEGDPVADARATFAVGKPAALRKALARRDVTALDAEGLWHLKSRDGRQNAQLEWIGDELLVSALSGARLERAIEWLGRIAGLRHQRTEVRALEDARDDRELRQPTPAPPVDVEMLRAVLEQHYLKWLDDPLPMFGGKTPRQVARKNAAGRTRVAATIRALPAVPTQAGTSVEPPRARMLHELGLD